MANDIAVVTGTTSGIGLAVARLLLDRGWRVLGVGRRPAPFTDDRYEHVRADLHDLDALAHSVGSRLTNLLGDRSIRRVGLVNNAADPGLLGPVANLDARSLGGVFTVNVSAPIWLMSAIVRLSSRSATTRIVNLSSGAAGRAFPGLAAYGSSKAALRMAGMVLASELDGDPAQAGRNLSILSYEPGTVDTPMQAHARAQSAAVLPSIALFAGFAAQHMLIPPEAPAREMVAFLDSDSAPRFSERRFGT